MRISPEVEIALSLAATFVETGVDARGKGGYARELTADERLLLRMRAVMDAPGEQAALVLELEEKEGPRLAAALAQLEALQQWSADVLAMSRSLRSRLAPLP